MMKKVRLEKLIAQQEGFPSFSRALLEDRQLELLNVQLHRAKRSSGFYASYPDSVPSLSQLSLLPFTTPKMLADNFSRLCLLSSDELARLRTERTSGTLGNPKKVAYSQYDCDRTLDFFECGLGELIFPGDSVLICMPFTDTLSLGGLIASAVKRLGAVPVCIGADKTYGEYIDAADEHAANVYVGAPVLLLSLLRLMDSGKRFDRALISGDYCCDTIKTTCEKLMDSRLFPHYGLRESGLGCAYTCSAHSGMHIRENDIICEIIGQDGAVVPRGEWGELVITTIGLEAMPLFRYKTGDFARILPGTCPCGSDLLRLEVTERISSSISIGYYDDILFAFDEVIDFLIQGNTATISVTKESDSLALAIAKLLRGFEIRFCVVSHDSKPMYPGKRRIL